MRQEVEGIFTMRRRMNLWRGKCRLSVKRRNQRGAWVINGFYEIVMLAEGIDFSHSRRIGNFDECRRMNIFSDKGYQQGDCNRRVRAGGNATYHQAGKKIVNYGAGIHFLSDKYGDFLIWRSPSQAYRPSPFTNMGRDGNPFQVVPFYNFNHPDR